MANVLGIDPGNRHLGAGVLELNLEKKSKIKLVYADSFKGELNEFDIRPDVPIINKAKGLTRVYGYLVDRFEPVSVSVEDNFLGPSPSSFKRLIEVVTLMCYRTYMDQPDIPFHTVLPRLAKQIIGVDFKGTSKEDVVLGLQKCKFLDLNGIDISKLSEHANDGILIGLYEAVTIYKEHGWDLLNDSDFK